MNSTVIPYLYQKGFKWEWRKGLAFSFFLIGMALFPFAKHLILLMIAVAVFIMGEVVAMPCYDEIAKKYAHDSSSGSDSYYGILGLCDGFARLTGSVIALTLYGMMRKTVFVHWFWPLLIIIFIVLVLGIYRFAGVIGVNKPCVVEYKHRL